MRALLTSGKELYVYRVLIRSLVVRDFKARYRDWSTAARRRLLKTA